MPGTDPSTRPTTASGAKPKLHTRSDLIEQPKDWVRAHAGRMKEPPNWWPEFLSLYKGCARELLMTFVQ